jgi:plastocyanin
VLEHADRFSVVLQKPGTYEYICTIHPYQHGKLHVYRRGKAT